MIPAGRLRFRKYVASVDWGFAAPGCLQIWGVDGDRRMYLVREYYRTKQLIAWWVERAKAAKETFDPEVFACDPAEPGFIKEFKAVGIKAIGAFNDINVGVNAIRERLTVADDGRARLFILRDSLVERDEELAAQKKPTCCADEFELYMLAKNADGRPIKEKPVDDNNHALDACRYAVSYVDKLATRRSSGRLIY